MLLFLVTTCLVVAVQPCMEWIPIKKIPSKKGNQPSFSFYIENVMLGCWDDKYSLNLSALSGEENSINMPSI